MAEFYKKKMTTRAEVHTTESVGECDFGDPVIVNDMCAEQLEILKHTDAEVVANSGANHSECASLFHVLPAKYQDAAVSAMDKDVAGPVDKRSKDEEERNVWSRGALVRTGAQRSSDSVTAQKADCEVSGAEEGEPLAQQAKQEKPILAPENNAAGTIDVDRLSRRDLEDDDDALSTVDGFKNNGTGNNTSDPLGQSSRLPRTPAWNKISGVSTTMTQNRRQRGIKVMYVPRPQQRQNRW